MKKYSRDIFVVAIIFIIWRFYLNFIESISSQLIPIRIGFLGPSRWTNFDGIHYLTIAKEGYHEFLLAFFPLYPLMIKYFVQIFPYSITLVQSALIISNLALVIGLYIFYLYLKASGIDAIWTIFFLLLFPASFFFVAVYPMGLFFLFASMVLYFVQKEKWKLAALSCLLASATRLTGIFLIIIVVNEYLTKVRKRNIFDTLWIAIMPLGLIAYMLYLWIYWGDPLAFFHVQPAFGAGRSGSTLILLPQVIWRYAKIFLTVSPKLFEFRIASFEFISFVFFMSLIIIGFKMKFSKSLLFYSLAVLILPTVTGTLSSFPRYSLEAFPLFIILSKISQSWLKVLICIILGISLFYVCSAFFQGYFVS